MTISNLISYRTCLNWRKTRLQQYYSLVDVTTVGQWASRCRTHQEARIFQTHLLVRRHQPQAEASVWAVADLRGWRFTVRYKFHETYAGRLALPRQPERVGEHGFSRFHLRCAFRLRWARLQAQVPSFTPFRFLSNLAVWSNYVFAKFIIRLASFL